MRLWPRKRVYVDNLPKTHDLRFAAIFVLGFCLLLGGLYAVGHAVAGDRLPTGTTVAGIDIGGMRRGEARTHLQSSLAARLDQPITVSAVGKSIVVNPQRVGLTFDLDATLDEGLAGDSWDPRHLLHVVTGGGAVTLVVDVDRRELAAGLGRLNRRIEQAPVNSRVVFGRDGPSVIAGADGRALDYDEAGQRLGAALNVGDDKVKLGVRSIEPDVTAAEANRFLRRVAEPATAKAVRIDVARVELTLQPRQFAPSMRAVVRRGRLELDVKPGSLLRRTQTAIAGFPQRPVNAKITFRHARPVIVPSRSGVTVDPDNWAAVVLRAAGRSGPHRRAVAKPMPDDPSLTTQQARMLRIKERVSHATVPRPPGVAVSDARQLLAGLDGTLVRPGHEFSFLGQVGAGDAELVSRVASASYESALKAGMTDIVRSSGQYYDRSSDAGLDARVERPDTDLAWHNDTPYGVYIRAWIDDRDHRIHLELWSSHYWEIRLTTNARYDEVAASVQRDTSRHCQPRAGSNGFDVDIERVFLRHGQRERVERSHSAYDPLDRIVCERGRRF